MLKLLETLSVSRIERWDVSNKSGDCGTHSAEEIEAMLVATMLTVVGAIIMIVGVARWRWR